MDETAYLTNHFLIAMPGLADANFARTVTYICQHSEQGAMGVVVNRPMEINLGQVLKHMQIDTSGCPDVDRPVYSGGPVQPEHGFVLHTPAGAWDTSLRVTDEIAVTTSRDVLTAIARGEGPTEYLLALGYAGWGEGQLEFEMAQNAWLSGPADPQILFRASAEQCWLEAARWLGVDLHLLSNEAGHA